jgi:hypothetical protein
MSSEDDRLILIAWAEIKLKAAPPRCRRFVAALEAMSVESRDRFLAVSLLYGGDLKTLLPEKLITCAETTDAE